MRTALLTLLVLLVSLGRLGHAPLLPTKEPRLEAHRGAPLAEAVGSRDAGWVRAVAEGNGPSPFPLEALQPEPATRFARQACSGPVRELSARRVFDVERALFVAIGCRLSRAPPSI